MKIDDILQSLPTREDVARMIGGRGENSAADEIAGMLGAFATGMVLGAGLALLFAPKTGNALRRDLAEKLNDVGERLHKAKDAATPSRSAA